MLLRCLDIEASHVGSALNALQSGSILEVLISVFCRQLADAVRQGTFRSYRTESFNLSVLRGRLVVSQQMGQNFARPDRLFCEFDEFSEDNPLNQALKLALNVLQSVSVSACNQRLIRELLFCFDAVSKVQPADVEWNALAPGRLAMRFKDILRLAQLFIESRPPDVVSGAEKGFAFVFDMNQLFESYIGRVARSTFSRFGCITFLQGPPQFFATEGAFKMLPDIVLKHDGRHVRVIDTKWKRLSPGATREGVSSADAYQMFAYAHRYEVDETILLYPHHNELGEWRPRRATYEFPRHGTDVSDSVSSLTVATVGLDDLQRVPEQLVRLVQLEHSATT
jgi:5-methylcytosine-specific restriction enzyme subunit McrC